MTNKKIKNRKYIRNKKKSKKQWKRKEEMAIKLNKERIMKITGSNKERGKKEN